MKARKDSGGCVRSEVEGRVTYACTTSDPAMVPVFLIVTVITTSISAPVIAGSDNRKLEYSNVVYDKPCLYKG